MCVCNYVHIPTYVSGIYYEYMNSINEIYYIKNLYLRYIDTSIIQKQELELFDSPEKSEHN